MGSFREIGKSVGIIILTWGLLVEDLEVFLDEIDCLEGDTMSYEFNISLRSWCFVLVNIEGSFIFLKNLEYSLMQKLF